MASQTRKRNEKKQRMIRVVSLSLAALMIGMAVFSAIFSADGLF